MKDRVKFENVSFAMEEILFDAQTSGGLLASICREDGENALAEIEALGLPCAIVGEITEKKIDSVIVR